MRLTVTIHALSYQWRQVHAHAIQGYPLQALQGGTALLYSRKFTNTAGARVCVFSGPCGMWMCGSGGRQAACVCMGVSRHAHSRVRMCVWLNPCARLCGCVFCPCVCACVHARMHQGLSGVSSTSPFCSPHPSGLLLPYAVPNSTFAGAGLVPKPCAADKLRALTQCHPRVRRCTSGRQHAARNP